MRVLLTLLRGKDTWLSFPPIGTVNSSQEVNLRFKNNKTICTGKKVYNSNAQHENHYTGNNTYFARKSYILV